MADRHLFTLEHISQTVRWKDRTQHACGFVHLGLDSLPGGLSSLERWGTFKHCHFIMGLGRWQLAQWSVLDNHTHDVLVIYHWPQVD